MTGADSVDVAVVGGGITGCLAAERLAAHGLDVVLFEAGRDPREAAEPPVEEHFASDDHAPFTWSRRTELGGRLHEWHGCSPRFLAEDFVGWPLGLSDLASYYEQAESGLQVHSSPLSPLEERVALSLQEKVAGVTVTPRPIARLTFDAMCARIERAARLDVRTSSPVVRLHRSRPGAVDGVEFVHGGEVRRTGARAVVLCASTIQTARILLNSDGIGQAQGLGTRLMDHTCGVSCEGHVDTDAESSSGIYIHTRDGYGCEAQFPDAGDAGVYWVHAFGAVDANPENTVSLESASRPTELPPPKVRLSYSDADRARIRAARDLFEVMMKVPGVGRSVVADEVATPGSSAHDLGTARMGADPRTSFLNRFNQSWDFPNLFVTDGSAFRTSPPPNPTLTMVALTLRACDSLADRLRVGPVELLA